MLVALCTVAAWAAILGTVAAQPRVWLSCPPSFNTSLLRQAVTTGPCENVDAASVSSFAVTAGSRLKVGWDSGNRGGGFVRLSLAPVSRISEAAFNQSVLKVTCFGHDSRPGRYACVAPPFSPFICAASLGNCNHPCNARGGCEFQASVDDTERYDTTITVPFNLADGDYVIQLAAFVGNTDSAIYSCSKITVSGGDPTLSCPAADQIPVPSNCTIALSPDALSLTANSQAGQFCYDPNGPGSIDARISEVPVNYDCDPRISCDLARNPDRCITDFPTVLNPDTSPHQICATTPTGPFSTSTASSSAPSSSEVPSSSPTPAPSSSSTSQTTSSEDTSTTTPTPTPTAESTPAPSSSSTKSLGTKTRKLNTRTATPAPTYCASPYSVIEPGSPCNVNTSPLSCSGDDYAQCAWIEPTPHKPVQGWVIRKCPKGTACRMIAPGHPVCDYPYRRCK
ncbi:hypothetical protein HK105_209098 [Polyrhizophydium stewartii]|uniref:Uncharacterized protein n=1 Tax=Polyrhizophydium stewartii TaxID=2732419 RepID=A0ABR4MW10_9FUNG